MTARTGHPIIAQQLFLVASAFHRAEAEGMSMSRRKPAIATARAEPIAGPVATPVSAGSAVEGADVTALLIAWSEGDGAALDTLLPVVYAELRRQARRALRREAAGHTLQPTALVHEAYLKLVDQRPGRWHGRAQFYGVAARCMRQVLVDAARTRRAAKRGGGAQPITLSDADGTPASEGEAAGDDVLALDAALARLAALDPDQARLVELRYFAGLTLDDTAATLGVSSATVSREWRVARRWLRRELTRSAK
ncbi:MAG TPA: ECF-type sigma factor [Gemmatimonadaceae bacterium]|nr:ECF-type sigma factor [Gemmatimonadaceae bacterium]